MILVDIDALGQGKLWLKELQPGAGSVRQLVRLSTSPKTRRKPTYVLGLLRSPLRQHG